MNGMPKNLFVLSWSIPFLILALTCREPIRSVHFNRLTQHLLSHAPEKISPGSSAHRHEHGGSTHKHSHAQKSATTNPFSHKHGPNEPSHDHGAEFFASIGADIAQETHVRLLSRSKIHVIQNFRLLSQLPAKPYVKNLFRPPIFA